MKRILFFLLLTCSMTTMAQVYNNEWIDYSKTYYKFKSARTGLHRISLSVLNSAGLATVPAEQFQLWRNGVQVPLFTSVASGTLPAGGYIEFWGQLNDGKVDKELYRVANNHLNDRWSLLTDTASYFLTVNPVVAENLRFQQAANNTGGTLPPAEPYFMHTAARYFKDKVNNGYAVNVGEYLYSSSYDKGEGWSSTDITSTVNATVGITYGSHTSSLTNLFPYTSGPAAKFNITVSGNTVTQRRYRVLINGDSVLGKQVDYFNSSSDTTTFPVTSLSSGTANVVLTNVANIACLPLPVGCQTDRMVIHKYELTYPRLFNFGGATNFEFNLGASATGQYLEITNFSYGSTAPVLIDLTNNQRYTADISAAPMLKFFLPASTEGRRLILSSVESSEIQQVAELQTRNFVNYLSPSNIGDYLIISHQNLFNGPNGNPVEDYRAYRASAAGGSFNSRIYLSDELVDQFAFGIKKHPMSVRNFIRWAKNVFPVTPKYVFLIGRGVNYQGQRSTDISANMVDRDNLSKLNLVPTFGIPASDVMLTAEPGSSQPDIPIGRLSAIIPQEVTLYLDKVKEYELAQKTGSPATADKAWMKNVVHIIGASDTDLGTVLGDAMTRFKNIIKDTLFGANVSTFAKNTSDAITQLNNSHLVKLFNDGISLITYFGHSSATTLEFNLDNPENYNNQGKYPIFLGLGCNAGNFYNYSTLRFIVKETISEKYVLAPNRGTIAFVASSHFGIVHYLDLWNTRAYKRISQSAYGTSIGNIMKKTAEDVFLANTQDDFYARANVEQSQLHGDPALTINPHPKPDYVIEAPMVRIDPQFVSVADGSFKVYAKTVNLGRAPKSPIVMEVKRQFPNGNISVVKRDTLNGVMFADSVMVTVPIDPINDKGLNKIIVTIDADNAVDELYETNNSITKDVMIYEDEARPVYPYNFAIINKPQVKFVASTANPFSPSKEYRMELDTTELFNSPFKITRSITTTGGEMEFDPNLTFTDSTVYYWRVAPVPASGPMSWNTASFIYLANHDLGYAQSHLYQHLKSGVQSISLDSNSRTWKYGSILQNLFVRIGSWVTSSGQEAAFSVSVNTDPYMRNTCYFQSLVFNVFDPISFKPMRNQTIVPNAILGGLFGSLPVCSQARTWNFEYRWDSVSNRKRAMDFMVNNIPDGSYVVVRSFLLDPVAFPAVANLIKYAGDWRADTLVHGSGQSIYHMLRNSGFADIDSFNRPRNFVFIYKKNDPSFTPKWIFTDGVYDNRTLAADVPTKDTIGFISSPMFGPAKAWKQLKWKGGTLDPTTGDDPVVVLLGRKLNGQVDTVYSNIHQGQQNLDISSISATQYPYLQIVMVNKDTTHYTPYQLKHWRLTYVPAPEGAVSPNRFFQMKDTVDVAEPLEFKMAFRNVSEAAFPDSIKVRLVITDRNNVTHVLPTWKQRSLPVNDTLHIRYPVDTRQLVGSNYMYAEINPDNDQPEQYHFNNYFFRGFYVRGDTLNPLLDVTFDNVRILNRDIVSAKPNIMIRLKDEAKWYLLNDTATMKVQVRFPDQTLRDYTFDGTTMQFIPASQAPNSDNTATVNLRPMFDQDGEYELIVSAKDMSQNAAGALQYRVAFQVYNKPMISNMLNYPNPFTTQTAFVFTITGSEVPQNIRIQILTVTGKVVREITKEELGPLHIGRNITEFKWDGTDQYGQKLANGVYLYRVVTNLNGKSLDHFRNKGEDTDKYFNKGYGKMYLMR